MSSEYTVACYYFPNYHPSDGRNHKQKGQSWSEWELVKAARPRFEGHLQPKIPLWGYTDESDPQAMAQKIAAAGDHGIDAFIFDWYYYDDGPFLERALDEGFFNAPNRERMKFALMWANHDWIDIHPWRSGTPQHLLYPGQVSLATWERIVALSVERYFRHTCYWRINGALYFSIYELSKFIKNFGSIAATRKAIELFRSKVEDAGLVALHLNVVLWGRPILPGEQTVEKPELLVKELGFDSITSYVWIHHARMKHFPVTEYQEVETLYLDHAQYAVENYPLPYYPNVSMGWDASPRCHQDSRFEQNTYPFTPVLKNNTPQAFEEALQRMRGFLDRNPEKTQKIFNLNCWNEWTEGSYLEPDTVHGFAYLEALRRVFGVSKNPL